jgi:hypothetical protein
MTAADIAAAPVVRLTSDHRLLLDDEEIARTDDVDALASPRKIDALYLALKMRREDYRLANPGRGFPGVAILDIDEDVRAVTVKSVFQTAAFAGYPNVSFVLHDEALDAKSATPPPSAPPPHAVRRGADQPLHP